jgi:glutaredoxin 3
MFCARTKEYLSKKNIPFQEKDVSSDDAALAELQKIGFMTTPVTVIGDVVIVGFDTAKIDAALNQ